jgi:hypothetical protein
VCRSYRARGLLWPRSTDIWLLRSHPYCPEPRQVCLHLTHRISKLQGPYGAGKRKPTAVEFRQAPGAGGCREESWTPRRAVFPRALPQLDAPPLPVILSLFARSRPLFASAFSCTSRDVGLSSGGMRTGRESCRRVPRRRLGARQRGLPPAGSPTGGSDEKDVHLVT